MIIIFVDRAHTCIFPLINKNPRGERKIKYEVQDGAITLDAILKTLAGILSRPVLSTLFKFLSVLA